MTGLFFVLERLRKPASHARRWRDQAAMGAATTKNTATVMVLTSGGAVLQPIG